jgi:dCMP deaminase
MVPEIRFDRCPRRSCFGPAVQSAIFHSDQCRCPCAHPLDAVPQTVQYFPSQPFGRKKNRLMLMVVILRIEALKGPPPSLEDFLRASDHQMYDRRSGISRIVDRATLKLINPDTTIDALHTHLSSLNLTDVERLRPGWDAYFMQLAALAAKRSNCMKRRVGCVLIREKRVIATGYNGTPRGLKNCNDGGCQRCNSGSAGGTALATCLCLHAEENALLEAGRERVGVGATLYCDT